MTTHTLLSSALAAAAGAGAGALLGWAYFSLLRRAVEAFIARPSRQRLLAGSGARMLAAAAVLMALATLGPAALIGALPGFVLARALLLRKQRLPRAVRAGQQR